MEKRAGDPEVVRQLAVAAATGVTSGTVRFGLLRGKLAQSLLFERDLVRKPVSKRRFDRLWPLLGQQRTYLMPLVQPKGIYCFYTRELVAELAALIDGRPALEIAAGDGTLSRFLREAGVEITATDDHSWGAVARTPDVVHQEAREALRRHRPQVVLCSWPPAPNAFERHVFTTPGVELYVVVSTVHEFGAGDWDAYRRQTAFSVEERPDLAELVLPPELDPMVWVFRRRDG